MTPGTDFIAQASTFVKYTPSSNDVPYKRCVFYLDTDASVNLVDKDGNTVTGVSLKAGYHQIQVKKITSVSAGNVYLGTNTEL